MVALTVGNPTADRAALLSCAYTGLGTFIVATLLYTDAANTAITNMSLYGREVFGMDQAGIQNPLLFSTAFAVAGSLGFGYASD